MIDKIIIGGYGILLLMGAFFGWKAGSKISMIMGLASGALVLVGLYLTGTQPKNGFLFLTIVGGFLAGVFLSRFLKTHQMMPSGMLLIVSSAFVIYCLLRLSKI